MMLLVVVLIFFGVLGTFLYMAYRSETNRAMLAEREKNSLPPED